MWKCKLCDLCIRANSITPVGHQYSDILVLLNHPDYYENKHIEALNSEKGKLITKCFNHIGFNINEIYTTYVLKCNPKGNYTTYQMDKCTSSYLSIEFERISPKIIIVFDNETLINLGKVLKLKLDVSKPFQIAKSYAVFLMPDVSKWAYNKENSYPLAKFDELFEFYKKHINPVRIKVINN